MRGNTLFSFFPYRITSSSPSKIHKLSHFSDPYLCLATCLPVRVGKPGESGCPGHDGGGRRQPGKPSKRNDKTQTPCLPGLTSGSMNILPLVRLAKRYTLKSSNHNVTLARCPAGPLIMQTTQTDSPSSDQQRPLRVSWTPSPFPLNLCYSALLIFLQIYKGDQNAEQ